MGYQGMATHSKTKFKYYCLPKIQLSIRTLQCFSEKNDKTSEPRNVGIIKTSEPWNTGIIKTSEQRAEV